MNEERLKALLREAPIPDEEHAERRGLLVVREALSAERQPPPRRPLPRLTIAFGIGALLAILVLSPAGAQVRDWINAAFTSGVPDAEPALTEVPGGGRLLVQTPDGPWVVQPDGSRRLLGDYAEATWSPHGLFVGTASGLTLSAVEPDGSPRWSFSSEAPVSDPRWSPSGFKIAYRSGGALRVIAGDGTGDVPLDRRVASLPAAWSPQGIHRLAYVDADGELRIVNADTGKTLTSAAALSGIALLGWSPDGSMLLEASRQAIRLREVTIRKLAGELGLAPARRLPLPPDAEVRAAAFSPRDGTVAALLGLPAGKAGAPRSEVVLFEAGGIPAQRLFSVPGRLSGLTWSPDGSRLLISWRDADQWLFIPIGRRGRIRAIGEISEEFAPGKTGRASFPQVEGWCCAG